MGKVKNTLMELQERATANICACYWYEFQDAKYDFTLADWTKCAETPYFCHIENGDDLTECPEWQMEQAEIQMDQLREEGKNV